MKGRTVKILNIRRFSGKCDKFWNTKKTNLRIEGQGENGITTAPERRWKVIMKGTAVRIWNVKNYFRNVG